MTGNNNINDDNSWEDVSSTENFFEDIDKTTDDNTPLIPEEIENSSVEDKRSKKDKEETTSVKPEKDLFEEKGAVVKSDEEEENITSPKKKSSKDNDLYELYKDKGLITIEDDEDESSFDEVKKMELINEGFENEIENAIKERLSSLPEDVQNIVKASINGGDYKEYLKIGGDSNINFENIDKEDEKEQKQFLRYILKDSGDDDEAIEIQLQYLEDNDKLGTFFKSKYNKWESNIRTAKENFSKEQEKLAREARKADFDFKKELGAELISNKNSINELGYSSKDKRDIPDYIRDKNVKLQNGNFITEMQKDLFYEIPKNKTALLQLAILLKNRNKDGSFNFDSIAEQQEDKVTKKIRNGMRRTPDSDLNTRKKQNRNIQSIADYFD